MIFRPKARGKHPGIIICHGFASSKYTKTRLARNISKKGFVVMIFDASGNGESDGRFEDHTVAKYLEDLRKAVEFLKRQNFVDAKRIGIAGTSLGGFLSMAYASKYRDVKAIIPVASPYRGHNGKIGPFSNKNFMAEWKKNGFALFDVRINSKKVPKKLSYNFFKDYKSFTNTNLIKKIKCPIIVVHGDADDIVPINHGFNIMKNAPAQKEMIIVKGAGHSFKGKYERTLEKILLHGFRKLL